MIQLVQTPSNRRATPHGRSRNQLEEIVRRRLRESSYVQLRDITCCSTAGVVVLSGRVTSFYLKQVAQMVVSYIDGVEQVDNQLEVIDWPNRVSTTRFVSHQGG